MPHDGLEHTARKRGWFGSRSRVHEFDQRRLIRSPSDPYSTTAMRRKLCRHLR